MVLGKCAKIGFLSQSENYIVTTKFVLMRMIVMKIRYFHGHTGILTEPMRQQNLYISYGDTFMKQALYYVFEFKCSKVIRIKKPGLRPCLPYKILRILLLKQQYHALNPWAQNIIFYRGNPLDSPKKNEHYQALSLSLPWEIFCFKCLFLCIFPILSSYYIYPKTCFLMT